MDNDYQPYARVESLYGPGTVGAWLLTVLSVFISWTLNKKSRRKDTISIDFLAVLTLPTVAAGHLFYLVAHLPTSIATVLTAEDIDAVQRTAAIEAPLNICETFSIVALVLASCCGPFYASGTKWKRLGLTLAVGLLSWATEQFLFERATRKGVRAADAMLSRPYGFLVTPIVGSVWAFLGVCLVIAIGFVLSSLLLRLHRRNNRTQSSRVDHEIPMQRSIPGDAIVIDEMDAAAYAERMRRQMRPVEHETIMMKSITVVTLLFLPLTFVSTFISVFTMETKSQALDQTLGRPAKPTQPFFIPKSSGTLSNLDQALALATGVMVVFYSVVAAWTSMKHVPASN